METAEDAFLVVKTIQSLPLNFLQERKKPTHQMLPEFSGAVTAPIKAEATPFNTARRPSLETIKITFDLHLFLI